MRTGWRRCGLAFLPSSLTNTTPDKAFFFTAYVGPKVPVSQLAQRDSPISAAPELKLDNAHTRRTGRALGDGLYRYKYLAQVHKSTRLQLDTGDATLWEIDGELVSESPSTELEFTFTSIGKHTVSVYDGKYVFEVDVKAVRYEIRDLSDDDREAYFHALHTVTIVPARFTARCLAHPRPRCAAALHSKPGGG